MDDMDDWIEIGAKRVHGWKKPIMFIYGAIDKSEQFFQEFPEYPWEWNEERRCRLYINKDWIL